MWKFLVLMLLFVIGCQPDEEEVHANGTGSLVLNGVSKIFDIYYSTDSEKVNLYFDAFDGEYRKYALAFGSIEKQVYIPDSILPYKTNSNNDKEYASLYTFIDGGDLRGNVYKILSSEPMFFQVTSWDNAKQEMEGGFNISFVIDTSNFNIDYELPDTLSITDRVFKVKLD